MNDRVNQIKLQRLNEAIADIEALRQWLKGAKAMSVFEALDKTHSIKTSLDFVKATEEEGQ